MTQLRLLLVAVLLLVGLPILSSSASAKTTPTPPCASDRLRLFDSGWFGAGGMGAMVFDIVNRGARCRIGGYPTVTFVTPQDFIADGHDLHRPSMFFAEPVASTLSLAQGGVGTFGVSWDDNPVGKQTCPGTARARVVLRRGLGNLSSLLPINPSPCGRNLLVTSIEPGTWPRQNG